MRSGKTPGMVVPGENGVIMPQRASRHRRHLAVYFFISAIWLAAGLAAAHHKKQSRAGVAPEYSAVIQTQ